jgi:hypothetical protein
MGLARRSGWVLGLTVLAFSAPGCGGGPDFDRAVVVLGDGPFTVNASALWADRGTDTRVTLYNAATRADVVHDFILTSPTDGQVVAQILGVRAGQTGSVRFFAPVPVGAGAVLYPFHCAQPGHDDSGALEIVSARPKASTPSTLSR